MLCVRDKLWIQWVKCCHPGSRQWLYSPLCLIEVTSGDIHLQAGTPLGNSMTGSCSVTGLPGGSPKRVGTVSARGNNFARTGLSVTLYLDRQSWRGFLLAVLRNCFCSLISVILSFISSLLCLLSLPHLCHPSSYTSWQKYFLCSLACLIRIQVNCQITDYFMFVILCFTFYFWHLLVIGHRWNMLKVRILLRNFWWSAESDHVVLS